MEIIVLPDPDAVARTAADIIEQQVRRGPSVLGLATGSTPLGTYRELIDRHRHGLSFADAQAFLLDEYVGLPASHPESYRSVIRREFAGHVDFAPDAVHGLDGEAADPAAEAARYEASIAAAGGVDVQLLGIGTDGHIGFNEPMSSLASRTRIKTLTEQTRRDNARFFASPDEVPEHVLTQGLGTILEARHLLLLGLGEAKAAAVDAVRFQTVSSCPARARLAAIRDPMIPRPRKAILVMHRSLRTTGARLRPPGGAPAPRGPVHPGRGGSGGELEVLGLGQVLVRRAVAVVRERRALARRALARARPALQGVAVDVEARLRGLSQELVGECQVALHDVQHARLRAHREVGADVVEQGFGGVGEVVTVGRQALDRRLAGSEHAPVIGVRAFRVRILEDLVRDLPVDRPAEHVHGFTP
jgi:glucosamine-6-phosphate deaminase